MHARGLVLAVAAALAAAACAPDPAPVAPQSPGAAAPAPPSGPPPEPPGPQRDRDLDTPPTLEFVSKGTGDVLRRGELVLLHVVAKIDLDGRTALDTRASQDAVPYRVGSGQGPRGWDLVLPSLRVGDRVKFQLRSDLAYGDRGVTGAVPAKGSLTYDLEVVARAPLPTWKVIASGDGREARPGSLATVRYVMRLTDGTLLEDSKTFGKDVSFRVGGGETIEGWDYVVSRMRVGDHWDVRIPWLFGYGVEGAPPHVPQKADLLYDVELLRVED